MRVGAGVMRLNGVIQIKVGDRRREATCTIKTQVISGSGSSLSFKR
jgi:hypothetical protein